jgi:hypothetical protein
MTQGAAVSSARRRTGVSALVLLALGLGLGACSSAADVKAQPAAPQGADPAVWAGAFCGGLGDVITGVSAIAKSQPSPQGQKDGLLEFTDIAQRAFSSTAQKLTQLGPPRITDGKKVQDAAVNFFASAAETVSGQRAKLAELDAKDPDFVQKASHLPGPDLGAASTKMQELTSNKELTPAFKAAPQCQRLSAPPPAPR